MLQWPHVPLEHVPTPQSELVLQWPHVPLEHVPLPLQSDVVLQPPHIPLEHVPVLQSELVLQWLHVPLEQFPWPWQSELVLQWPHEPLEQLPKPPQSEARAAVRLGGRREQDRRRRVGLDDDVVIGRDHRRGDGLEVGWMVAGAACGDGQGKEHETFVHGVTLTRTCV